MSNPPVRVCPRCQTPIPRTRRPTSWRQAMWGGWSCAGCGAELDARLQVIGGRVDGAEGIVVALTPPHQRRDRFLVVLGGFVAPAVAVATLLLRNLYGDPALFIGFGIMVALMAIGMVGLVSSSSGKGVLSATLTTTEVRWGNQRVRTVDITAARREGDGVCIEANGETHRLSTLGDPTALLEAIAEVRAAARDTGTRADVPDALRRVQGTQGVER